MKILARYVAVIAAFALASSVCAQTTAPDSSKPITLDQALDIAFQKSPNFKIAVDQALKSRGVVNESKANFNPKFSTTVTQIRQGPPTSFTMPGSTTPVQIVRAENTTAQANAALPIDINNKLGSVLDISKYQYHIDYLNLIGASQKLIFDVKKSYYNLLGAMGLEEVAQAAVDVASSRLKDASARFTVGTAPKFDVTRAEVDVANLNQQLISAKNLVAIALSGFNRTLGLDVNLPTAVVKSENPIDPQMKIDIPAQIELAYKQRPEVQQALTVVDISKKNIKLQRTSLLPSLDLTGSINYDFKVAGLTTANTAWAALLTLRYDVWNGGITKAKVEQAFADSMKAADTLTQTKLGVSFDVRVAALTVQEAMERISSTSENVALAEEALRLATVRYNAGYAILVEVTDAESALTQARYNVVKARYDFDIALADLQRATSTQPEMGDLQRFVDKAAV